MSDAVERWLESIGLAELAETFARNHIELDLVPRLTADDLRDLGLSIGQRRRFLDAAERLAAEPPSETRTEVAPAQSDAAQRRQLTVMFCDLVGSTALSRQLDPEELRELILAFQRTCQRAIDRYGGFVARYMGDGVLAYFGYPQAHEDDAERAVHAGLAVVDAVRSLHPLPSVAPATRLATRVGIATGPVVVGDLIGEGASREHSVVGNTPNLAARLQSLAGADEVVVSDSTHAVAGGRFDYEDLGASALKGFSEPVPAWRVLAPTTAASRFEALRGEAATPLVGRELEVRLLLERWEQARDGEGQVVFLSGEAGIGKSRVAEALRERTAGQRTTRLRYQCSPHHSDSALHPVIEHLTRAARLENDDARSTRLRKLEQLLSLGTDATARHVSLIAALLSIPVEGHYPPLDMAPEQQKEATLSALVSQMETLARRRPVLLVFEDVHWADATSLELLAHLVEHAQSVPALLVVTSRPGFTPAWAGDSHVTSLTLNRFGRRLAEKMIDRLTSGKRLPEAVRTQIIDKTDGVPLFVEELTKTVLESGLLADRGDRYALEAPLPALAIPSTLHDSLMARLDRLAPVREIAQLAAVIGREFAPAVLSAVAPLPPEALERALARLVEAGLLFRRGTPPRVRYVFKHALVQDAAYGSLLKSRRRELHERIARALAEDFALGGPIEPELLAHHYTEAGLVEPALEHWLAAGTRAAERAAYIEAVSHLTRGLSLLAGVPEGAERARHEIALRVALGVPLMKSKTVASPEVGENYQQARRVCDEFGDSRQRFPVLWGQWYHNMLQFEVRQACGLADELLKEARPLEDDSLELEAHHCQWASRFLVGDPVASLEHANEGLRLYRPETHHPLMFVYGGHDPGVCAYDVGALTLWLAGDTRRAASRMGSALALAQRLGQSSTLANCLSKALTLAGIRRDPEPMSELGEQLMEHTKGEWAEQSRPHAAAALGWVEFEHGARAQGLARMREAVGTGLLEDPWNIYTVTTIATALALEGALDEAIALVERALALSRRNDVHWWAAELLRVKGALLARDPTVGPEQARTWLEHAYETAASQAARSLQLRAALSLERSIESSREWSAERAPTAGELAAFVAGFGADDVREARSIVERLD